ncbi:MAG: hypothetical protein HC771_21275 [Synechococcales cyanobacterium CRU_2_2]|nr:hypothetical protein [Synechococcales cyanobacterium CRU_2_2]
MPSIELLPSAEATYARTLISRGCPPHLGIAVANILANVDSHRVRSLAEQAAVERAWASITQSADEAET